MYDVYILYVSCMPIVLVWLIHIVVHEVNMSLAESSYIYSEMK